MLGTNSIPEPQRESDIDSVFHSFSHNKDGDTDGDRDVDETNSQNALDEVLRRWDINVGEKEQTALTKSFKLQWNNYSNTDGKLDTTQAIGFVRSVMDDV